MVFAFEPTHTVVVSAKKTDKYVLLLLYDYFNCLLFIRSAFPKSLSFKRESNVNHLKQNSGLPTGHKIVC